MYCHVCGDRAVTTSLGYHVMAEVLKNGYGLYGLYGLKCLYRLASHHSIEKGWTIGVYEYDGSTSPHIVGIPSTAILS